MVQRGRAAGTPGSVASSNGPGAEIGFHRKATSETLALSGTGQSIAMRRGIKRGLAIGRQPCRHRSGIGNAGWAYVVMVRQVNWEHFSSGLWVGLTASTPQTLIGLLAEGSLDFAADVPDTVVVGGEGVLWDGAECVGVDWHTGKLEMGDEIRVSMSMRGDFRVKVNGKVVVSVSKVYVPHNRPLYPLVELHGSTEAVELLSDELPISPLAKSRPAQMLDELDLEPREDVLVHHEHPRTPPHAMTPPFGGRQHLAMASEQDEASTQASPGATPEAWALPTGKSSIRTCSSDRTCSNSPVRQNRSIAAAKATSAAHAAQQRGEHASSVPKSRPVSSAAGQRLTSSSSATALGTSKPSSQAAPARQPFRTGGAGSRHAEEQAAVRERMLDKGRIPKGGPSDWRVQAHVWSTVDDCLTHPHKHNEAFYAMCRELAATRAERDTAEAKFQEQRRQASKSVAESQRRDREIRKMREELHEQSAKLEESISAIEVLSKRTAAAQEAKNRAQHEAWHLRTQLEGDQKKSEKLDRKVSRALESAEQAASLAGTAPSARNNASHLRHLEATFESALSEIRSALGSELSSIAGPARASSQAAGASIAVTSPVKVGSASRNASASPRPARRGSAKGRQRPPRGPGNPPARKSEERARTLAMSTSVESLSAQDVADESTTCSSPRAGSGSVPIAPEFAAGHAQAMAVQGAALLRPEAGSTPTSASHWAWPGDVLTASQATVLTARGDVPP
mmetsp:Transcript_40986/g.73727  ORF Transcript_40986/g.73727 Transcript_40986/m.73727 type:complete len:738 (-) Transcript_40986:99-2312(-)